MPSTAGAERVVSSGTVLWDLSPEVLITLCPVREEGLSGGSLGINRYRPISFISLVYQITVTVRNFSSLI